MVLSTNDHCCQNEKSLEKAAATLLQCLEDLRLAELVEHALRATGHLTLCDAEVTVQAQVVTLIGRVPTFYLKQLAQTAAGAVEGIERVQNELVVA